MRWLVHVAAAASMAAVLAACGSVMPIGPTNPSDGIIIYLDADYVGTSLQLAVDVPDLRDVEGPCLGGDDDSETARWNDCVSSIRVMPGWHATLYRNPDYKGASVTVSEDTANLQRLPGPCSGTFNDCVSSIRISRQ